MLGLLLGKLPLHLVLSAQALTAAVASWPSDLPSWPSWKLLWQMPAALLPAAVGWPPQLDPPNCNTPARCCSCEAIYCKALINVC